MKTRFLKIKGDWQEVVNDCRATVGKAPLDHDPSSKFKKEILIAEHSPIRDISIKWLWASMPHWCTVHWCRHKFEKFIRSQRSDRTGIPRDKLPQDEPQDFTGEANTQSLIDVWRKRLCFRASPETRAYAEDFKTELRPIEPEISDVLVPNCVYRCGCCEIKSCGFWDAYIAENPERRTDNLQRRYDLYNQYFYDRRSDGE